MEGHDRLLTQSEVARLFRVDSKTVQRWRKLGWFTSIRTPGGAPRYRESEVRALLARPADDRPGSSTPPKVMTPPPSGPVPHPKEHPNV